MTEKQRQLVIAMIEELGLSSPEQVADFVLSEQSLGRAIEQVARAARHDGLCGEDIIAGMATAQRNNS